MNRADQLIYEALRDHVTGLFRIYTEFVPGIPFRVVCADNILLCEVVEFNTDQSSFDYSPVYIIFKCGVLFFKLEGYQDSYGGLEWDGHIVEVSRKEQVVYLYE